MFTGIIEEAGTVERLATRASGAELRIRARRVVEGSADGDSIAVNGVCLTARTITADGFSADLSPETLNRSALSSLHTGSRVNLERAILPTTRLGGHIVQGHVDGVGKVHALRELGDGNWWLTVEIPAEVERYCVFKGSISIDGVSLTIAALDGMLLSVAVIPLTYTSTTIQGYRPGQAVNLEIDIVAKYVEKLLASREQHPVSKLSEAKLRELGY